MIRLLKLYKYVVIVKKNHHKKKAKERMRDRSIEEKKKRNSLYDGNGIINISNLQNEHNKIYFSAKKSLVEQNKFYRSQSEKSKNFFTLTLINKNYFYFNFF